MRARRSRTIAASIIALCVIVSSTGLVFARGDHDLGMPIPIMEPPEGEGSIPVAVYFADNMVYAPQWRTGNLVRIETMVLNVSTCFVEDVLDMTLMPLDVNTSVSGLVDELGEPLTYDQSDLMEDPYLLYDTYMVSISEIQIDITMKDADVSYHFYGDFTGEDPVGEVGREINKAGHLIYGFLWDTEIDDVAPGDYEVSVTLPASYDIHAAVAHVYPESDETTNGDPIREKPTDQVPPLGFAVLPGGDTSGCGGVRDLTNQAFVYLGTLIEGGGAGTSGDNGDVNGGGNDETGNGGNMNGKLNGRHKR